MIRHPTPDELPTFIDAMSTAFLERPDVEKVAADVRGLWDLDRVWGAFENGRPVGTFRSFPTEITVPGCARIPASGIAAVTVMPDYRRRGILRRMVATEHAAARDRRDAALLLYAAEWPIYGRFGYGPACVEATWTLDAAGARFHGDSSGAVALVPADATARDAAIAVYEAWRVRRVGEIRRLAYRWDYQFGLRPETWDARSWNGFVALHRNAAGEVDGYARYHADDHWEQRQPRVTVELDELHALDTAAYADLWRFLASMDWVATVKATRRSRSEVLPWLLVNGRAAHLGESGDGLWVRLLDVRKALEGRTYERDGRLVLEVVDGEAVDGRLRLELDAGPDGATCRSTDRSADLTLDVAALGAAYLGGTRLRDAVLVRGADEHRPGALAEADALFRALEDPWCSTSF